MHDEYTRRKSRKQKGWGPMIQLGMQGKERVAVSSGEGAKGHSRIISMTEPESSTVNTKQKTGHRMARISPNGLMIPCEEVELPW